MRRWPTGERVVVRLRARSRRAGTASWRGKLVTSSMRFWRGVSWFILMVLMMVDGLWKME